MNNKHKVVLLGESGVGKTTCGHRMKFNKFLSHTDSTIGCEFFSKTIKYDNKDRTFLIWDTSGQEIFRTFTPQFTRNSKLALLFIESVSSQKQVNKQLSDWTKLTPSDTPILIVPTKIDLIANDNVDWKIESPNYLAKPISAKDNVNIESLLNQMAEIIPEDDSFAYFGNISFDNMEEDKHKCCIIT